MTGSVGYVVIEFNQASHMPDLDHRGLYDTAEDAEAEAERARTETAAVGRRERYAVAEILLLGDLT